MEPMLFDVNRTYFEFLYNLLKERDDTINISHTKMPSYEEHVRFWESSPYKICKVMSLFRYYTENTLNCEIIPFGYIYLSKKDEIGIFITKAYQNKGFGTKILRRFIHNYVPDEVKTVYANINPKNYRSAKLFKSIGFKHIQNTFSMEFKNMEEKIHTKNYDSGLKQRDFAQEQADEIEKNKYAVKEEDTALELEICEGVSKPEEIPKPINFTERNFTQYGNIPMGFDKETLGKFDLDLKKLLDIIGLIKSLTDSVNKLIEILKK